MVNPVREWLIKNGKSGIWLAREIGVTQPCISRLITRGTRQLTPTVYKVAAVMDIDPTLLLRQLEGWLDWQRSENN